MSSSTTSRPLAIFYARQSHGSKKSVDEQIDEGVDDLRAEGYEVIEVLYDLKPGSRFFKGHREDHAKMLDYVRGRSTHRGRRIGAVGMWESSRGDRELESWAGFLNRCRDNGVRIRVTSHEQTYDMAKTRHYDTLAQDGVVNARYSNETSDRNKRTARATAKAGKPNGPCPYGYRRDYHFETQKDEKTGKVEQVRITEQTEDPSTGPVVREVFRRVADGEPILALANELNDRGVPTAGQWRGTSTRYSHRWTPHGIRALVKNKTYLGQRAHNGSAETHKAIWPAIVDESLFYAANRVLAERARHYFRAHRAEHLLSGVPRCDRCGDGVFSGSAAGRKGKLYTCRTCGSSITDGPAFEDRVIAYVLGRLAKPDVQSKLRVHGEDADAERTRADDEVETLNGRLATWREAAANGEVDPDDFADIAANLRQQIAEAERRAERAGVPPQVRRLVDADDVYAEWDAMPLSARRDVVAVLVEVRVAAAHKRRLPLDERVTIRLKAGL